MNEGHRAGPQLVGQLTEDDAVGQSFCQVLRQGPLQPRLKDLKGRERRRIGGSESAGSSSLHLPSSAKAPG